MKELDEALADLLVAIQRVREELTRSPVVIQVDTDKLEKAFLYQRLKTIRSNLELDLREDVIIRDITEIMNEISGDKNKE